MVNKKLYDGLVWQLHENLNIVADSISENLKDENRRQFDDLVDDFVTTIYYDKDVSNRVEKLKDINERIMILRSIINKGLF